MALHVETPLRDNYTAFMSATRSLLPLPNFLVRIVVLLICWMLLLISPVPGTRADNGVYSLLPSDIEVIRYRLGDIDNDGLKEMGLLFRWREKVHLTVFRSGNGRWARWWNLAETSSPGKGLSLYSFDIIDSNGDGACEISLYLLAPGDGGMTTRILAFTGTGDNGPHFETILEDVTMPPGYPIYGTENGSPSVTFLNMGGESVDGTKLPGYRRVYCWNSTRFKKCLEVKWETP